VEDPDRFTRVRHRRELVLPPAGGFAHVVQCPQPVRHIVTAEGRGDPSGQLGSPPPRMVVSASPADARASTNPASTSVSKSASSSGLGGRRTGRRSRTTARANSSLLAFTGGANRSPPTAANGPGICAFPQHYRSGVGCVAALAREVILGANLINGHAERDLNEVHPLAFGVQASGSRQQRSGHVASVASPRVV
jgi:hypothetical protein